ncbi:hypothetical protein MA16_Dca000357 [Dendrobium catenatum]|uniref:Uncharacterized protein n=1 Tax=Dendrobium catenatum TaxID=906689 RepID=A0A2I0WTP8_9ASPA|nr:hypothetical protein MA16_Dca000357 [Dendrobium catenatum]
MDRLAENRRMCVLLCIVMLFASFQWASSAIEDGVYCILACSSFSSYDDFLKLFKACFTADEDYVAAHLADFGRVLGNLALRS